MFASSARLEDSNVSSRLVSAGGVPALDVVDLHRGQKPVQPPNPLDSANWLEVVTYRFLTPLLDLGTRKVLQPEDVPSLPRGDDVESLEKSVPFGSVGASGATSAALTRIILLSGWRFAAAGFLAALTAAAQLGTPLLVKELLVFLRDPTSSGPRGWILAASIGVIQALISYIHNSGFYHVIRYSVHLRTALMHRLFVKSMATTAAAKGRMSTGHAVTVMSSDTERVAQSIYSAHYLWIGPLQCVIVVALMVREIGWAALAGALFMLLLVPVQAHLAASIAASRTSMLHHTDERVLTETELMAGIRVVKMYAWEDPFAARVAAMRNAEVAWLRRILLLKTVNLALMFVWPTFATLAVFGAYSLGGGELDVVKAFAIVALLFVLRIPMAVIPAAVGAASEGRVSVGRIAAFLAQEELDSPAPGAALGSAAPAPSSASAKVLLVPASAPAPRSDFGAAAAAAEQPTVEVRAASFSWDSKAPSPLLVDLDLTVRPGALVAIVGPVASGKSSLVLALMGELHRCAGQVSVRGGVAYTSQQPWLRSASVRENVEFGMQDDPERFARVVEASALGPDLASLPHGADTEIGERGITLSGGQKARVSLARALYRRDACDVFIFDDPLSAVDSHVARHIFRRAIQDELAGKTRLVVMNSHMHFLPEFDEVWVMGPAPSVPAGSSTRLPRAGSASSVQAADVSSPSSFSSSPESALASPDRMRPDPPDARSGASSSTDATDESNREVEKDTHSGRSGSAGSPPRRMSRTDSTSSLSSEGAHQSAAAASSSVSPLASPKSSAPAVARPRSESDASSSPSSTASDESEPSTDGTRPGRSGPAASPPPKRSPRAVSTRSLSVSVDAAQPAAVAAAPSASTTTDTTSGGSASSSAASGPRLTILARGSFAELRERFPDLMRGSEVDASGAAGPSSLQRGVSDPAGEPSEPRAVSGEKKAAAGPAAVPARSLPEDGESSTRLVKAEDRREGAVALSSLWEWIAAGTGTGRAGKAFAVLLAAVMVASQLTRVLSDWWLSRWSGDQGSPPAAHSTGYWLWTYAVWAVAVAVTALARSYQFAVVSMRSSASLHASVVHALLRAPINLFFDVTPLGRIANRLSADTDRVDVSLPEVLLEFSQHALFMVVAALLCCATAPWFTLVLVPLGACVVYFVRYFRASSRELKRLESVSRSPVFALFAETIGGMSTIRAFRMRDAFCRHAAGLIEANARDRVVHALVQRWLSVRLDTLAATMLLVVALLAVWSRDRVPTSVSALAIVYALQFSGLLQWSARLMVNVEDGLTSVERLADLRAIRQEAPYDATELGSSGVGGVGGGGVPQAGKVVLSAAVVPGVASAGEVEMDPELGITAADRKRPAKEVVPTASGPARAPLGAAAPAGWPAQGQVEFRNLELRYRPGLPLVLRGVSCEFLAGEKVGICGRTGAGKTSLLQALFRLVEAESPGSVWIDGVDAQTLPLRDLRSAIGVIPQDPVLFSGTVRMNLDPFDQYSDDEVWAALEKVHVASSLRELAAAAKLADPLRLVVREYGSNMSQGERQLLCIGRALLRRCRIVCVDEGTSSVDMATDSLIQETLREVFVGCTVLTIAHRLDTIIFSDRILVLDRGRVAEFDTPARLLADGRNGAFAAIVDRTGPTTSSWLRRAARGAVAPDELRRAVSENGAAGSELVTTTAAAATD